MKKLCLLPLLILLLAALGTTALAASIPGQQSIASIADQHGYVSALTDDDATTAWTKDSNGNPDLTVHLYSASVGEIWIRSGYAYTQNWYNHYDRPDTVKVTVYYQANQYTTTYDVYRYRLTDAYRPYELSDSWNSGYQRLLLPKRYTGVTKIELTIESAITGSGRTGATISDLIVASGSHATPTPKSRATATPKPYVVYVTPTPGPNTDKDDPLIEWITPVPKPTSTPVVSLITPTPAPTREPIVYPSTGGVITTLTSRAATRSGPSTNFDEPGSFFSSGDEVKAISKAWDATNRLYWVQIEFQYRGEWYRAYTTDSRVNVELSFIPDEPALGDPLETRRMAEKTRVYFGPGTQYKMYTVSTLHADNPVDIYAIENGWVQIEYTDYGLDDMPRRRGWVPLNTVYGK